MNLYRTIQQKWDQYRTSLLWVNGALLMLYSVILLGLSPRFTVETALKDKPVIILVSIMLMAGVVYALPALKTGSFSITGKHRLYIFVVGLVMRLVLIPSTPMLENDFNRYLWDGAVTAEGFNPFAYSPEVAMNEGEARKQNYPEKIITLAKAGHTVTSQINYPHLRTIYPPVAQFFFAVAYLIKPWDITVWRLLLLIVDLIIVLLLILLCKQMNIPTANVLVYWWNPVMVKEFYNSAHMDLLIIPLVLGALFFVARNRWYKASGLIGLSIGTKIWPVILIPLFFKKTGKKAGTVIISMLIIVTVIVLMLWPVLQSTPDRTSGFTAYAQRWEMNDALFMSIEWMVKKGLAFLHLPVMLHFKITRMIVIILLGLVALKLFLKKQSSAYDIAAKSGMMVAALYLLSPTQFPWYFVWVMPFLVFRPSPGLILMSIMTSLYYCRFFLNARGLVHWFDYGVVWIEYIPVWVLLIWEYRKARKRAGV